MISATLGTDIRTARITIPISTDVGTTIGALLALQGLGPAPVTVEIRGVLSDGTTSRAAFVVASPRSPGAVAAGTDYSTHGVAVAAGADWQAPPGDRCGSLLIRSTAAAFDAIVVAVY